MSHKLENADWDTVRVFLAVARVRSLRKAAVDVGMTPGTVAKTLDRLEDLIGYPLFHRDLEGARMTAEGRRLFESALAVEKTVTDLWRLAATSNTTMSGPIRLAVTEGLGTFWVMPPLADYVHDRSRIRVELNAAMKSVDVLRFEADISIQFQKPLNPDLIVRRMATLHLTWFASDDYVARNGIPASFEEMARHSIVEQETDQLKDYGLDGLFGPGSTDRMVRIKTNFSSAHYWAVAKGAGIGLLPNYARLIGARLRPMPFEWSYPVGVYMATHPEIAKSARHRHFIDWLAEIFSSARFPWFGETYITPQDLDRHPAVPSMREYFEGFVASAEMQRKAS